MQRRITGFAALCLSAVLLLSACQCNNAELSDDTTTTVAVSTDSDFDENDLNGSPDLTNATTITLSDTQSTVEGDGASVSGSTVTVSKAGIYVLTGTLSDGQVRVNCKEDGIVWLVLDNASIHCETSAPLYIKKAEKTIVTLQSGSQNTLSDGDSYVFDDAESEEPNATLFSKKDLTINGSGTLTVNAAFNNGITSKDGLKLVDGTLTVTAADDGVMGRDYVMIGGGTISVTAEGDGIKSTNDTGDGVGFIRVSGGALDITAGTDGVQATTDLTVSGGTISMTTGGGSANASSGTNSGGWGQWGNSSSTQDSSAKGLKADGVITLSGGEITVDSSDDSVHSNDTVSVTGGTLTLTSGDDGIHADNTLTISDGVITITKSYEALEAQAIHIDGGDITLTASDDGINAAGGDGSSMGRPGANSFGSSTSATLDITGGTLRVDAQGDGLDSNGDITMSGGTVYVNGPNSSDDGALDYETSFSITGGTLIAVGSVGMAEAPTSNSQNSILWNGASGTAGDTVSLTDASGNMLISLTAARSYGWVYITTPDLQADTSYTVFAGSNSQTLTMSSGTNTIGNASGGFGGMGGDMGGFGDMGGGMGGDPAGNDQFNTDTMPDMGEAPDMGEMPNAGEMPDMGAMPNGETPPNMPNA